MSELRVLCPSCLLQLLSAAGALLTHDKVLATCGGVGSVFAVVCQIWQKCGIKGGRTSAPGCACMLGLAIAGWSRPRRRCCHHW
jgi:hypothetical protein